MTTVPDTLKIKESLKLLSPTSRTFVSGPKNQFFEFLQKKFHVKIAKDGHSQDLIQITGKNTRRSCRQRHYQRT